MEITRGYLDIIFRHQSPKSIIKSTFQKDEKRRKQLHSNIDKNCFINLAINQFKYYSEDEVVNIYYNLLNSMKDMRELSRGLAEGKKFSSVFNLLIQFTDDILIENNKEPFCKYEHMLRWRMISHNLEQDIFTTAYFAYRDVLSSRKRNYFSWKPVIKSDNNRLHEMLKKGLAENHFHLKGSAPYFNLTWISLMNRIVNRNSEFEKTGMTNKRLESYVDFSEKEDNWTMSMRVRKAAVIRAFLFCELNNVEFFDSEKNEEEKIDNKSAKIKELKDLLLGESLELEAGDIQERINILNYEFGYKFDNNYYHGNTSVDYCIPKNLTITNNNGNVFLVGERRFMYLMFKKIYERDEKILKYADLFYAYLIIKSKFRGELIQINDRVGFKNFADYQDRKTKFLSNDPMLYDAIHYMAISSTMKEQNVKSLEARICPENTAIETDELVKYIDRVVKREEKSKKLFNSQTEKEKEFEEILGLREEENKKEKEYFYVIHFPKIKDETDYNKANDIDNKLILSMKTRDYNRRKYVKEQSLNIVSLREKISPTVKRILGIDACANEIGCRPEVFAQSFRFLSNHTNGTEYDYIYDEHEIPQLKSTYHAGEDFLDLADGLRAIDEAIKFLGLSHGDRIGHALALGVDVDEWYKSKHYRLVLPKQDYLDNITWILAKIREFSIYNTENLVYELENEFNRIFQEIYQEYFESEKFKNFRYNHMTYYEAWKLRGDDPYLYLECEFKKEIEICYWDRCKINNLIDDSIRNNINCAYIYYNYHFNTKVKKAGAEQHEFSVSKAYVKAVKEIQKKMQRIIAAKGIGIETNPSSNYLIGNFKRYDKHPIINFYNLGLTYDREKINDCSQLFVSINTDDQGVFGTYLENEYALMAIALEKAKDENGQPLYNQAMIYDWLDRIRQMGLEQSFMKK